MTTLTVEVEKQKDLAALRDTLNKLGLKYTIEEERWEDGLSDAEIAGIKAGLADIDAGRVHTHAEVAKKISQKLQNLRK